MARENSGRFAVRQRIDMVMLATRFVWFPLFALTLASVSACATSPDDGDGSSLGADAATEGGFSHQSNAGDAALSADAASSFDGNVEAAHDGGLVESGLVDAALTDAAFLDAAFLDAASLDAGGRDSGLSDAGSGDAGSYDPGVAIVTTVLTDSASSGTPDTYQINVKSGDRVTATIAGGGAGRWSVNVSNGLSQGIYCSGMAACTLTVRANDTVLFVTAVTDDIGFYKLSITHPDRGFR